MNVESRDPGAPVGVELRRALLDHYDRSARALPWRGESDPYRILVSEVMLQQTRVETVIQYYGRWLERFPDLAALADAAEDDVLKAWEGLGYYRRARNLHRAARVVRERADGRLPPDAAELRMLPGVGEYTAGAVASIAFGVVAPAVDGNVRRVLSRLFDVARPTASWLRNAATSLVDPERPGDWNQALMELGATVCSPRAPACGDCPVARWCEARAAGTAHERPAPKARAVVPTVHFALGVFHADDMVLLARRRPDGLLGGLWALPERGSEPARHRRSIDGLADELGLDVRGPAEPLAPCEHRFTHLHAVYQPWAVAVRAPSRAHGAQGDDRAWVDGAGAAALALPVAQRRVLDAWWASRRSTGRGAVAR